MPTIELPEFGTNKTNENEPTAALKQSGWAGGDQPPASVTNWIARTGYDGIRRTLGLAQTLSPLAGFAALGRVNADDTASDLTALGCDLSDGTLIAAGIHAVQPSGYVFQIFRSTDGGVTWVQQADISDSDYDAPFGFACVPGAYAVFFTQPFASNTYFLAAPAPYTTWAEYTHDFGGNIVGSIVANVNGIGSVLIVATDAGSLWHTDAGAVPTVTGDWAESDLTSIVPNMTGIAFDGSTIVVSGDDGASGAVVAYAAVADGVAVGDFTVVSVFGGTQVVDVAWNGELFIALTDTPKIWTSPDGVTWTVRSAQAIAGMGTAGLSLTSDPATGATFIAERVGSLDTNVWSVRDTAVVQAQDAIALAVDPAAGRRLVIHPQSRRLLALQDTTHNQYLMSTV